MVMLGYLLGYYIALYLHDVIIGVACSCIVYMQLMTVYGLETLITLEFNSCND